MLRTVVNGSRVNFSRLFAPMPAFLLVLQVRTIATDLTAPGSCQQLLQQLSDTPITVLIANVGGGACGPMVYWEYTDEDEAYVQALNGQACYSLVKGLLPSMIERNKGAIVAVSSIMHKVRPVWVHCWVQKLETRSPRNDDHFVLILAD